MHADRKLRSRSSLSGFLDASEKPDKHENLAANRAGLDPPDKAASGEKVNAVLCG